MALLGTHTLKDVPIRVYASIDDPEYTRTKDAIVIAVAHFTVYQDLYCANLECAACPFYAKGATSCIPVVNDFLHIHYSSQYPEYFI